jgi:RNA polymerase sigma-70 factor (ECF subfamily)
MAPAFALASAGEADGLNQPVEIMDQILQLRKNVLSDLLDKALRKIEQVLTRPVNTSMDGKSMYDVRDIKNSKEQEASFLKVIDDYHGIIDKMSRAYCKTRDDRADLYQEIVYQLWAAYPSFTGDSKISTWIYKIAVRSAIMPFRRKNRIKIELHEVLPDRPGEEPYEGVDDDLFNLFLRLGRYERAALALLAEGYTRGEVGPIMGLGKHAVKKRIARAIKAMENYQNE